MVQEVCFPSGNCLPVIDPQDNVGFHEEHWDPNNSGNPLLDTSTENLQSVKLSDNFSAKEFIRSGGNISSRSRIDPKLVEQVQKIRDVVNKPVTISSGYRSWDYNFNVIYGGDPDQVTKSEHCSGRAADIKIDGMLPYEIGKLALENGYCDTRIGVGNHNVGNHTFHVDIKKGSYVLPMSARIWSYPTGQPPDEVNDLKTLRNEMDMQLNCSGASEEWPVHQEGDSGPNIKTLQYLLKAQAYNLTADGVFTAETAEAIREIQSVHGLAPTGIVDQTMWPLLIITIRQGDTGSAVQAVQVQLDITVDGVFGPQTKSAVEQFQSQQGLTTDGIVGPITWNMLVKH